MFKRMGDCCLGPPPAAAGNGGMRQQLSSLRAGLHPVTGLRLPAPSGSSALGNGTYSRLRPAAGTNNDFVPYVPGSFEPAAPTGDSADRKRWLMRGRVLCKISSEAARLRRMRRKEAKAEVKELIDSFLVAASGEEVVGTQPASDQEDEDFWMSLPAQSSHDRRHIREIPTQAPRNYPGKFVKSRADALRAAMIHGEDVSCPNG